MKYSLLILICVPVFLEFLIACKFHEQEKFLNSFAQNSCTTNHKQPEIHPEFFFSLVMMDIGLSLLVGIFGSL